MPPILEADRLVKKFGERTVVKDVSFDVREGEIFGLLGPNGAGKTTTIFMLTGVLEPTSGSACIGGHDLRNEPFAAKAFIMLVLVQVTLLFGVGSLFFRMPLGFFLIASRS